MVTFPATKNESKCHIVDHIQFLVKRHVAAYIKIAIQGCVADNMYVLLNGYISSNKKARIKCHHRPHTVLVKRNVTAYIKIIQGYVPYNHVCRFGWLFQQQERLESKTTSSTTYSFLVKRNVTLLCKDCYPRICPLQCVALDGYISSNKKARIKGHIIAHIRFGFKRNVTAYIKIVIKDMSPTICVSLWMVTFQQQQGSNQRPRHRPHTVLVKKTSPT